MGYEGQTEYLKLFVKEIETECESPAAIIPFHLGCLDLGYLVD
jgi:hypothetical protein